MGRKMRMVEGEAKVKGAIPIVQGDKTSNRCRATHDVPYSLRCVLEASHVMPVVLDSAHGGHAGYAMVRQHEDKNGGRW